MNSIKRSAVALTLILCAALATGCAAIQQKDSEAKLVTMYATIKIVNGDRDRAVRVEEIASEVRQYASGEKQITVDLLVDQIRKQVPWQKLDPADELLIHALIDELRLRLVDRFGPDPLPEDLQLAVDTVAEWVINAARMT